MNLIDTIFCVIFVIIALQIDFIRVMFIQNPLSLLIMWLIFWSLGEGMACYLQQLIPLSQKEMS